MEKPQAGTETPVVQFLSHSKTNTPHVSYCNDKVIEKLMRTALPAPLQVRTS
jgi:hypothetical protein